MTSKLKNAIKDIRESTKFGSLIHLLGWQEIRHRYRRSLLGPFWLVASAAVQVATICLVMGPMFSIPAGEYVPYVAAGIIVWNFCVSMLTESCQAFISQSTMIRQTAVPLSIHVLRVSWKNTLLFAHNLVIFPVAVWLCGAHTNAWALLAVPGFFVLLANIGWISLILAILSARYRDLPKTVESIVPVMMFLTPIIWKPDMMPHRAGVLILQFNPFYWLIDFVRAPLLGMPPQASHWVWGGCAAVLGWGAALLLFARARDRIVYWL